MSLILALVFGLFGDPSGLVDKYYVPITDPADLPDMTRMTPLSSRGTRSSLFGTGRYGWDPWRTTVRGKARVAAVIHRLGPPMDFVRTARTERGYMWRHRDPAKPHAGLMLVVNERSGVIELRDWSESDRARGYIGRVGVAGENEIYRWFEWLTTPLTPAEAAASPVVAPAPGGDVAP